MPIKSFIASATFKTKQHCQWVTIKYSVLRFRMIFFVFKTFTLAGKHSAPLKNEKLCSRIKV